MKKRKYTYYVGDFETTVYDGQESTEVWASAVVELYTEKVKILHSIEDTLNYLKSLHRNIIIYYHNLKFDGAFWLDYLLRGEFKQAYYKEKIGDDEYRYVWKKEKEMVSGEYKYSISDYGQWYTIVLKLGAYFIEFRDSLKLLPFSVKEIGNSFQTKHKKLEMEYKGLRYAGCEITPEEKEYIANDVLVVKEGIEMMFQEGHEGLTIGSCCLKEYKKICKTSTLNELDYNEMFPDLYGIKINKEKFGSENAGEYIRKSYRGGWCYLVKGKEETIFTDGITLDVNSLYPSMMHSESGSRYPIGMPHFFSKTIPDVATEPNKYYFVRIKTRFYLKDGYLPFVQIKNSYLYRGNEMLETSDVRYINKKTCEEEYYTHWKDRQGNLHDTRVELTLTMTEYQRLKEYYELVDFELLDGCWFYSLEGIFDEYIDKYKKIKVTSKGAKRTLAKLFLNNLYGKLAASTDSSFKIAYLNDNGEVKFISQHANDKEPGYIAVGSAITGYTRDFTIRAAQLNYYGKDKPGFIYADTDSLHCNIPFKDIKGIKLHESDFCCWKAESCWDKAIFTRQKTYIEHVTHEDFQEVEPYHEIKCAGMTKRCKQLLQYSINGEESIPEKEKFTGDEMKFLYFNDEFIQRDYIDFVSGLRIPSKLTAKRIRGGVLLKETTFEIGKTI